MLKIIEPGIQTTIQDAGRRGYQAQGVPVSGAMDIFSYRVANALARNSLGDAALEIHSPIAFETTRALLFAVAGANTRVRVNERALPQWTSIFARAGSLVEIAPTRGGWAYCAVHGGIDVPRVLGSRSTYLRGNFGGLNGRAFEAGDEIPVGDARVDLVSAAGKSASEFVSMWMKREPIARVIVGPHEDWFTREAIEAFVQTPFIISESADRMGYRLRGNLLARKPGEVISLGVPLGAMQVPPDGQPIVLMADHQTTGGYPIIATVISADISIVAQRVAGDELKFEIVEMDRAQAAWREMWKRIETMIEK